MSSQAYIVPDEEQNNQPKPPQEQPNVIRPTVPVDINSHMFQMNFYRKYFDLNSDMFFQRIKRAANPFNKSFDDSDTDETTELYGFFWITGTLIFFMFLSSTGANLLAHWLHSDDDVYEYSFDLLTLSITLFYGYNIAVPVILVLTTSFLLKFPQALSITRLMSIYGYTNILWIPITLINILAATFVSQKTHPVLLNLLEWIFVVTSGIITCLSNTLKISPIIKKNCFLVNNNDEATSRKQSYIIIGAIVVAHMLFTVLVKICFFGIY